MQYFTRIAIKQTAALLGGVLMALFGAAVLVVGGEEAPAAPPAAAQPAVQLATGTLPLRVSGVVEAADTTVVHAMTAGVVTSLLVREGATVQSGQTLAIQATPVLDAQLQLATAKRALDQVNGSLQTKLRDGEAMQAGYRARSATEIASIRAVANDERIVEAAALLETALQEQAVSMTEAVSFVHNHRPLFSADGLALYDDIVTQLYGSIPNHFRGGVMAGKSDSIDLTALISTVEQSDPAALELVASLVQAQLAALSTLYADAEPELYDRTSSYVTETVRADHLTQRSNVLDGERSIAVATANLQQALDRALEDVVAQDSTVQVTTLDAELASLQAAYAAVIEQQTDVVSAAGAAVVAAELSLGRPQAPFAGEVARVFVDEGAYVTPGTPLLTLVGTGARELVVSVPAHYLSQLAVGQAFAVDGRTVGFVERFSTVAAGGSGTVVIALSGKPPAPVGASVSGDLLLEMDEAVYQVPRAYVHFDAAGPFLIYEHGQETRVAVVYDAGTTLYVRVEQVASAALVPAVSIAL